MTCGQAKSLFSPYLDGAVTGMQMQAVSKHLEGCESCQQQYVSLRQTQQLLNKVGRRKAPAELGLKLRVAMSQEIARSKRPVMANMFVRLSNAIQSMMVPATAGTTASIIRAPAIMCTISTGTARAGQTPNAATGSVVAAPLARRAALLR